MLKGKFLRIDGTFPLGHWTADWVWKFLSQKLPLVVFDLEHNITQQGLYELCTFVKSNPGRDTKLEIQAIMSAQAQAAAKV